MKRFEVKLGGIAILTAALAILMALPVGAAPVAQDDDDLVARGEYLTTIAGCVECHTPVDPETFQPIAEMRFAGGQPFDLGPAGVVVSKNLTSDVETGLGGWTDEEIEVAIRTGVSKDGLRLFPVMPYLFFNNLADEDMDAIIAYLRTLPPINNPVPRQQLELPPLPPLEVREGIVAPDPSDTEARAQYLFTAVLACTDCHTPIDPETGAPQMENYLAGGQPFVGPWGTIYGGNITPHEETGIGGWTDEEIKRVLTTGVRPDGRVAVLMPWRLYGALTPEDLDAVVYYLRNEVQPVDRVVPAAALEEGWATFVEIEEEQPQTNTFLILAIVVGAVVGVALAAVIFMRRRNTPAA